MYFSPAFNTGTCRHLTLLYDVAQVRNSVGNQEPLLVMQWADGPCSNLKDWLIKHAGSCAATIQQRMSFAIQLCAGLRELHYGGQRSAPESGTPSSLDDNSAAAAAASSVRVLSFVHQDLKPDNILLFGGGEGDDGPVRLALTDFGLTVQYNIGKQNASCCGTASYMAPEQWLRLPPLSPGRDMWAAGMVLAELFGGTATVSAVAVYRRYLKNKGQLLMHECTVFS